MNFFFRVDLETINELNFTSYNSNFGYNHFASNKLHNIGKNTKRKSKKIVSSDDETEKKNRSLSSSPTFENNFLLSDTNEFESKFEFDFKFNADRDAKLIAKDANKKMKSDHVRLIFLNNIFKKTHKINVYFILMKLLQACLMKLKILICYIQKILYFNVYIINKIIFLFF